MAPVHRGVLGTARACSKKVILRRTNEGVSNWTELPDRCLYHSAPLVTPYSKYKWFGKKTCPVPNL
jgi:hypothetical protein